MNHECEVESGSACGKHEVFWLRCACGWIGPAAATDHEAQLTRKEHKR